MKRFNKLVATLLCTLMVFTSFNLNVFAENTSDELAIYSGSSIVSEIVLPSDEKVELQTSYDENSKYQWQLATDSNKTSWVNIYDQRGYSINLSYAMVSSLLDSSATTYVRVIKDEVVSQPVKVTVVQSNKQNGEVVDSAASAFRMLKSTNKINGATYNAEQPLADEQYKSYNIVVNYVYEGGSPAFDSYAANIEENGKFSTTVTFPTIVGYLPYYGNEQKNELEIDIEKVTSDITYTITYKPTLVSYTVIHMWQNALDDNYEIHETEIKEGLTNSVVEDCAKSYAGFTALLYETVKIAADGSTTVTVYYDRNYYLLNFDLDGGYGVEPIYARYGTKINDVGTPTKAGYIFNGWLYEGVGADIPETIPAENRVYKANWQTNNTAKVTIVFWGENANDEDYSYIKSSSVYVKPATEFTYKEDGSLICALEVHSHSNECGYKCGKEQHTHSDTCYKLACNHAHSLDCYTVDSPLRLDTTQEPSEKLTDQGNGIYTYTTSLWSFTVTHYYLKIGDIWYCAAWSNGDKFDEAKISLSCKHNHDDKCYELVCVKETHTHLDECYNCGKLQHTHQQECYMTNVGLDNNLWTFVKSDTIIIEADGSSVVNVYYDRTEKTLTFNYNYNNKYESTETITAKWGSNISEQYKKIAANAKSTFWSANTSGNGPWTNYFGVMPEVSATYYNRGKKGSEGTMTYLGQDLNGEYTVKLFEVPNVGGNSVTVEDRYEFEGYTYHDGTSIGSSCRGATFYYTRNTYTLTFNDGYNEVRTENVKYQQSLTEFRSFVPEVPSAYEPGSVTFAGWYLNPECTGNEYKLQEKTMPADNVLLYAKWEPVTHTVKFYLDRETCENDGATLASHPDEIVVHNGFINGVDIPKNGKYSFIGWFYLDNNEEKAFDFSNMPITKDMEVYGKWSSNVLVEYKIKYITKDENGLDVEIAAETTGSALAGTSKTFEAKTGTELYDGYQTGYYPNTGSHNITMNIDGENVYTFVYVAMPEVKYEVRYIENGTGKELAKTKTDTIKAAVVTEKFEVVAGYMPDAYQKRLVLSANEKENVIIFYYTADTENAYYVITHWVQNIEGDGYSEYRSIQAPGKIGDTISEEPLNITGFTYNSTDSKASGEITAAGLKLDLYYDRNTYPLTVKYLEYGTNTPLAEPYTTADLYRVGKQVSATAKDIKGYKLVGEKTKVKTISEPEDSNVITFYYIEEEVTISYVAIEAGYGTVSLPLEKLKAKTGTASGSTPTAKPRYRFVGWYTDEECTKPVDPSWIDSNNNKLVPQKVDGLNVSATYYAKFVENLGDLTIKKNGCSDIDENQTFLFRLQGLDEGVNDHIDMVVTIHGNGSVTIKDLFVGNYSVTELTDWSFRYTPDAVTKNVNVTTTGLELTFNNDRSLLWWLDGSNYKVNLFKQGN